MHTPKTNISAKSWIFFNEMLFRDLIHRNKEHILLSQYMKTGVPNYYYYLCVAEVYVQLRIFYKIDKTFICILQTKNTVVKRKSAQKKR